MSATCHADLGKKKYVHLVAADGTACMACHLAPDPARHRFELTAEGGELCAMCHGVKADKDHKHFPVAVGLCTFCHDPHQEDNPSQLRFPPDAELCLNCHDRNKFTGATVHGPVTEGQCLKCHDAHTSDHPYQTREALPDLCFGCHYKVLSDHEGQKLPSPEQTFEDKELTHHLPFGIGMCPMCHDPHASPNHRLLKSAYPDTFYTSYSSDKYVCFTCHDETAFQEARTETATAFRNGDLNLHHRHVNREKGRTCRACHHHHGAKNPKLIRDTVPFGNRHITIENFELTETGGTCGPTCHPVARYDRVEAVQNSFRVTPRQGEDESTGVLSGVKEAQPTK